MGDEGGGREVNGSPNKPSTIGRHSINRLTAPPAPSLSFLSSAY